MKNNDIKYKTIAIDSITHSTILKLANDNNKTCIEYVAAMAKYFAKYGVDIDSSPANLAKEIKSLDKRFIGFIRKQEELFHIPLANQMEIQNKELLSVKQIVQKLANKPDVISFEIVKQEGETFTISKSSMNAISSLYGSFVKLNNVYNLIPIQDKYSYHDLAKMGRVLVDKLPNASN